VAVGDAPYDAEAAGRAGIPTIGMLCGGFAEAALRAAGCIAVYPGPGALLACFGASPLAALCLSPTFLSEDIYRSSNGDVWRLIREAGSGRRFVRHEANAWAGGKITDTALNDFLSLPGSGPETIELRRMLLGE
jgi:hypothetical protein